MYPTLSPGDCMLFDRLAYREGLPQNMDVVLVRHPIKRNLMMVKRIVGGPGTSIIHHPEECIVDGIPFSKVADTPLDENTTTILQQEEYFVIGDYLHRSTDDSRTIGTFARHDIEAKAWLIYWPPSRWQLL